MRVNSRFAFILGVCFLSFLAGPSSAEAQRKRVASPGLQVRVLGTITNRFKQVNKYVAVPKGTTDAKLISMAESLHKTYPDTQLWFLDDGSRWPAVQKFVKDYESGATDLTNPMLDWLKKHVLGNLQQYGFGDKKHWVLGKGLFGDPRIADFK